MNPRGPKLVAALMLIVFVLAIASGAALSVANGDFARNPAGDIALIVAFAAFMVVGALITALRPGNAIGWVFAAIGMLAATGVLAQEYAEYAYVTRPEALPAAIVAAWYAAWWWYPTLALTLVFVPLLFPTGRPPSRRWRPVAWLAGLTTAAVTILAAVTPRLELQDEDYAVVNPLGVRAVGDVEESTVGAVLFGLVTVTLVAATVSLVVRFLRSTGDERQQLKWITYAGALLLLLPATDYLSIAHGVGDALFGIMISFLPIAAGIAVLKYRLYDVDVVINRTLVYGALTATLALVYVGGVLLLRTVLSPVTGDAQWSVAGSTLAVAALFGPARRRIQAAVDRRFYRARYDATRTVEVFAGRLRDEVDLDELRADLVGVVSRTLRPAQVSLWLRTEHSGTPR